jgi:alpha 1,2-mannosyltransferase
MFTGTRKLRSLLLIVAALFFVSSSIYIYWRPSNRFYAAHYADSPVDPLLGRQNAFWKSFRSLLEKHAPDCPSPERRQPAGAIGFNAVEAPPRPDLILLPQNDVEKMRQSHTKFIDEIKHSKDLRPIHTPGTRGIVSTAGGTYFPTFLFSLRMLRRVGSTLPVEVFIKDAAEYEAHLCEEILPEYNAKCIILSELLGGTRSEAFQIEHYQLKIFAVLFSSFEDVIWMDADCFPLHKPEDLLDSDPFKSTGMVTWPDFWASTASPLYYQISQQPVPLMTLRASSETGVFLVSKKTHFFTLLLAAYYNFYGPSHYFMLLSQGAPGEGDKETFIQAASALGESFYTVSERVQAIGHVKEGGGISGSAMVQSDPITDYRLTSEGKWRVKDPSVANPPPICFIHANYPKFNPGDNVFGNKWETSPTLNADGSHGRAWVVPAETIRAFGYDVEKAYWEEIMWVSCNFERSFKSWRGKSGICDEVQDYWNHVFEQPHDDDPKFTAD